MELEDYDKLVERDTEAFQISTYESAFKKSQETFLKSNAMLEQRAYKENLPTRAWAKSFTENILKNNNISAGINMLSEEEIDDTEDKNWTEIVRNIENAYDIAIAKGVSTEFTEAISLTNNEMEFDALINNIKKKDDIENEINKNLGTGGLVTSTIIGAFAGAETFAAFAVNPVAGGLAIASTGMKAYKTAQAMKTMKDAEHLAKVISRRKDIANVTGLSLSAAMPVLNYHVFDDYTLENGLIEFAVGAGLFRWDAHRFYSKAMNKLDESIASHKLIDDVVKEVGPSKPIDEPMQTTSSQGTVSNGLNLGAVFGAKNVAEEAAKKDELLSALMRTNKPVVSKVDEAASAGKTDNAIKQGIEKQFVGNISQAKKMIDDSVKKLDDLIEKTKSTLSSATNKADIVKLKQTLNQAKKDLKIFSEARDGITEANRVSTINKIFARKPKLIRDEVIRASNKVDEIITKMSKSKPAVKELDDLGQKTLKENDADSFVVNADREGNVELGVKLKDGTFKSLTGKQKLGVIGGSALAFQGTLEASGFNGGDDTNWFSYVPHVMLGAFLFLMMRDTKAGRALRNGKVTESLGAVYTAISHGTARLMSRNYRNSDDLYNMLPEIQEAMGIISNTVANKGTKEGKELGSKLFWSLDNHKKSTADRIKHDRSHNYSTDFSIAYDDAFKKYKEKTLATSKSKKVSDYDVVKTRDEFNKLVTDAVESDNLKLFDEDVQRVALVVRKMTDEMFDYLEAKGVNGFQKWKKIKNYVTRSPNPNSAFRTIASVGRFDESNKLFVEVRNRIADAYSLEHPKASGDEALKEATDYMAWIESMYNRNVNTIGDMIGEEASRAKARLKLDFSDWKDIEYEFEGKTYKFGLDNLFERDIEKLMSGYIHSVTGLMALADVGILDYTQALKVAGSQIDPSAKEALTTGLKHILGQSTFADADSKMYKIAQSAGNLASPMLLATSFVMQTKEVIGSTARAIAGYSDGSFLHAMRQVYDVLFKKGAVTDADTEWLIRLTSTGGSMRNHRLTARMYDDAAELFGSKNNDLASKAFEVSSDLRDWSIRAYAIVFLTDVGQRINARANRARFAKLVDGKISMSDSQMALNGISKADLDKFKGKFQFNSKGELTEESRKMIDDDVELRDELNRILFNMGNRQTLTPLTGTSTYYFMNSSIGKALAPLMTFLVNSYAVYQSSMTRGMMKMDMVEFMNAGMWFGTMYVAEKVKAELKNQERTEEELMQRALMNMPHTAFIGFSETLLTLQGAGSVAGETMIRDASNVLDIIASGEGKKGFK